MSLSSKYLMFHIVIYMANSQSSCGVKRLTINLLNMKASEGLKTKECGSTGSSSVIGHRSTLSKTRPVSGDGWFFGVILNHVTHLWPRRDCFYLVHGYLISLAFSFTGFWSYETCRHSIPPRSLIKHRRTLLKYTIHKIQYIHHTSDNFSDGLKELGPDYIIFGWQAESSPLYVNRICLRTSGSLFALMATPGHSISGWVMEAEIEGGTEGEVCVCVRVTIVEFPLQICTKPKHFFSNCQ